MSVQAWLWDLLASARDAGDGPKSPSRHAGVTLGVARRSRASEMPE